MSMNVDATWVDIGCLRCDLLRVVLAFDRAVALILDITAQLLNYRTGAKRPMHFSWHSTHIDIGRFAPVP